MYDRWKENAMLKIVGIIPARFNSNRFKGKPLADIAGKPMIEWTYWQAKRSKIIEKVIVATDDERIYRVVKSFGGEACLTSKKHKSGTDRVAEAARKLKMASRGIIVNIQGDEPLLDPSIIRRLINPLLKDSSLEMSTLSYRIRKAEEINNRNIVKVVTDKKGYALYFSRSLIPHDDNTERGNFYKHIGLYAYRKDFLLKFSRMAPTELEKREKLEQLRALENGHRIMVIESLFDPVEVDVPGDISKVLREIKNRDSGGRKARPYSRNDMAYVGNGFKPFR